MRQVCSKTIVFFLSFTRTGLSNSCKYNHLPYFDIISMSLDKIFYFNKIKSFKFGTSSTNRILKLFYKWLILHTIALIIHLILD